MRKGFNEEKQRLGGEESKVRLNSKQSAASELSTCSLQCTHKDVIPVTQDSDLCATRELPMPTTLPCSMMLSWLFGACAYHHRMQPFAQRRLVEIERARRNTLVFQDRKPETRALPDTGKIVVRSRCRSATTRHPWIPPRSPGVGAHRGCISISTAGAAVRYY